MGQTLESLDARELRMLRQQVRELTRDLQQRDATIDDLLALLRALQGEKPDATGCAGSDMVKSDHRQI